MNTKKHIDDANNEDATAHDISPPELEKSAADERDEYLAGWQRATADYQNLQQTMSREREHLTKYANRNLITDFLELADALNDAQRIAPSADITQINKKLHQLLERHGAKSIATVSGDAFDPALHESIGGSGEVVDNIVQQGYRMNDTIIRPSRVTLK